MDVIERYRRGVEHFDALVHAIEAPQWHEPTPCAGWDVRALVNHLTGELRWSVPLFDGATIADVGDRLDGDLLGDDPVAAWVASTAPALERATAAGALERTVHLSFGDTPGEVYLSQLAADLLVHAWDLARAIGADERLDPDEVAACAAWFADWEDGYRAAGVVGPRPPATADGSDAQGDLLRAFGREPSPDDTLAVIRRFNEAFGRHDVDAVMALMTDDVVFESTEPPHGREVRGQAAVRAVWAELFGSTPSARFVTVEGIVAGDRATYRWRYEFDGGSVSGVDVFRVREGKVAEKRAYVKG